MSQRTIFRLLDEIEHQIQHETTTTLKVNDLQQLLNNELIAIVEFNKENGYKTITDTNVMAEVMNNIELLPDIQKALLIIEYYHYSNGWDFDVMAISNMMKGQRDENFDDIKQHIMRITHEDPITY